ncbi:hypothetical protein CU254_27680 [Amycolatopsis sp. AA4]|uniref:hypothetical protein n=1 Tax=Actinomycetes TaxID=1760 RepID=UPI0001B575C9|nr:MULTISPECIES: hypothetical protein [Actinomycetes]ATY13791.1 hypothetical protein CU254_27680 [Amycolatopsis sp. AA4]EFL09781.1 predicted protein [Streptomyces sp. AA4]
MAQPGDLVITMRELQDEVRAVHDEVKGVRNELKTRSARGSTTTKPDPVPVTETLGRGVTETLTRVFGG